MTDHAANSDTPFDPTDPHGFHTSDTHGHVILSPFTLIGVLVALMVFTALTVFASRFELWMAEAFNMEIPQSVNVAIAMTIAVIKALLVLMFFMQLKYDSPLNSMIFATCIIAFGTFLGFTAIDLFSRDAIDRERAGEIQAGGLGGVHYRTEEVLNPETGEWEEKKVDLAGMAVAERAKTRERSPDEQRAVHHEEPPELSSANRAVRLTGLHLFATDHEQTEDAPANDDHADDAPEDGEDHGAGEPDDGSDG